MGFTHDFDAKLILQFLSGLHTIDYFVRDVKDAAGLADTTAFFKGTPSI